MPPFAPVPIRFWSKVDTSAGLFGCWVWRGARSSNGYGQLATGDNKKKPAHRLSYELHHGPIAPGLDVCHTCDNPPCVNPAHLWLGTPSDNGHDAFAKGRGYRHPTPERCPQGHLYAEVGFRRKNGSMTCRTCKLAGLRRLRAMAGRIEPRGVR